MSLHSEWLNIAQAERSKQDYNAFWNDYFDAETANYKKILARPTEPYEGKFSDLASAFGMAAHYFIGFIDGINDSLAAGAYDIDAIAEDSAISLRIDPDKLYFNMLKAKANWLYELPEWDELRTPGQRHEILKAFRASTVYVAENKTGRNDPCPCGSGKKYKKCCGATE